MPLSSRLCIANHPSTLIFRLPIGRRLGANLTPFRNEGARTASAPPRTAFCTPAAIGCSSCTVAAAGPHKMHDRCTRSAQGARPLQQTRTGCAVVARGPLKMQGRCSPRLISHARCRDSGVRAPYAGPSARFARLLQVERGNPAHLAGSLQESAQDARPFPVSPAFPLQNEFSKGLFPFGLQSPCILSGPARGNERMRGCGPGTGASPRNPTRPTTPPTRKSAPA